MSDEIKKPVNTRPFSPTNSQPINSKTGINTSQSTLNKTGNVSANAPLQNNQFVGKTNINNVNKPQSQIKLGGVQNKSPLNMTKSPRPSFNFQNDLKNSKPMTNFVLSNKVDNKTIVTSQSVATPVAKPVSKKRVTSMIVIIALICLVVMTTLLFVFVPKATRPSDISLDFNSSSSIKALNGDVGTINNKKLMPGDDLTCTFEITSGANSETDQGVNLNLYVRFRVYSLVDGNYYSNIMTLEFIDSDQWYFSGDGFYYYMGELSPNQVLTTIKKIHFNESIGNEFSGKQIKIMFSADALQAEYQAIDELWGTAPYEWAKAMKALE